VIATRAPASLTAALFVSVAVLAGAAPAFATAPTITEVSPDYGPTTGSTHVTIKGTNFVSGATVKFGAAAATGVSVGSSTSITAVSPAGTGTIDVVVTDSGGSSAVTSHDWFAYEAPSTGHWLGLDGNSVSNKASKEWLGPVNQFSKEGISYDRDFELYAGELPSETAKSEGGETYFEAQLKYDHEYGMVPVCVIEFKGYTGNYTPTTFFPVATRTTKEKEEGKTTISEYAEGFVKSYAAILKLVNEKYPGMPVYCEPMNEPWGYTTPQYSGSEYAAALTQVLADAKSDGIPLSDVYAAAFGADKIINGEGHEEWYSPGWIPAIYAAKPSLETEVQGWYFHPYGPPSGSEFNNSDGIQSVPEVRKLIKSGAGNIIVSEVGYCATAIGSCPEGTPLGTGAEAATSMGEMLTNALPYHTAGWLKALIVYSRNDGGWAMQKSVSELTPSGEKLDEFSHLHGGSFGPLTALSPATVTAGSGAARVVVSPDGKNAYVGNRYTTTISQYSRSASTGALTALSPATVTAGTDPEAVVVSPDGKYVYTVNKGSNNISEFSRNSETGALTALSPATIAAGEGPTGLSISPDGKFLYATNATSATISQYSRNASTGQLSALSPASVTAGANVLGIVVTPDGKNVYVANYGTGEVGEYARNAETGKLTALTTATIAAGTNPHDLAVSPDGKSIYVADGASPGAVKLLTRNTSTGELASGASIAAGEYTECVVVTPDGENVYATNEVSDTISQYTRNIYNGELSANSPTATIATGSAPEGIATSPDGRSVYATNHSAGTVSQYSRLP
jgi:DNA-binding beta-propeller fold protein YncE